MREEKQLKWEIGTLTARQRSYQVPSGLTILSKPAFTYRLESISSSRLLASNTQVYGPFRAPSTCHESQFSHLRPVKGHFTPKSGEIPTYTHLDEWQSCCSRNLLKR